MEIAEFGLKLGLAAIAGLAIGFEREWGGKNAGLKTNALVSLGACVFVLISAQFSGDDSVDNTRVLSQVVTGIGFIGAGTILQHGDKIKGLTSAATIWCSAGAGCLAAFSMYGELIVVSVMVIFINYVFGIIEHKIIRKHIKDEENRT